MSRHPTEKTPGLGELAFIAITDWINGAPCDDPAFWRSVANRLDTAYIQEVRS